MHPLLNQENGGQSSCLPLNPSLAPTIQPTGSPHGRKRACLRCLRTMRAPTPHTGSGGLRNFHVFSDCLCKRTLGSGLEPQHSGSAATGTSLHVLSAVQRSMGCILEAKKCELRWGPCHLGRYEASERTPRFICSGLRSVQGWFGRHLSKGTMGLCLYTVSNTCYLPDHPHEVVHEPQGSWIEE